MLSLPRARRVRILAVMVAIAVVILGANVAPASAESDGRTITAMTYNMDAGTDFMYFFALPGDPLLATQLTYQEIASTDFAGRAARMAEAIAAQQPDVISVQEATLWQTISATGRPHVLADQLLLLMGALWRHQQFYRVVAVQDLTSLTAPLGDGSYVRFLDRNVVLARVNFADRPLKLSNVRSGIYQATISPLPGFVQVNGWISVDVTLRGRTARFFATHLESPLSAQDATQVYQTAELIQLMEASPYPVVLAGDFNSDASGLTIGPDQTPSAGMIAQAGYADAWAALYPPYLGLTWPLYLEDVYAGPSTPFERIDLIFAKGLTPTTVQVVGTAEPFPSDHAGVVATLRLDR